MERGEVCLRRDLDDERLGQNKVLFSSQQHQIANGQTTKCRFSDAPCGREIGLRPSAGFWLHWKPNWLGFLFVTSSLSLHLARFLARLVDCLCFYLRDSVGLIISPAIGGVVLMVGEVAIGFLEWSLWNELMSFLRCYIAETGSQVFSFSAYFFQETR